MFGGLAGRWRLPACVQYDRLFRVHGGAQYWGGMFVQPTTAHLSQHVLLFVQLIRHCCHLVELMTTCLSVLYQFYNDSNNENNNYYYSACSDTPRIDKTSLVRLSVHRSGCLVWVPNLKIKNKQKIKLKHINIYWNKTMNCFCISQSLTESQ